MLNKASSTLHAHICYNSLYFFSSGHAGVVFTNLKSTIQKKKKTGVLQYEPKKKLKKGYSKCVFNR